MSDPDAAWSALSGIVIGCGSIGERHLRNLLDLGVDVGAVETDPERTRRIEREYGVSVAADLDAALAHAPAFAVVCVPNDSHITVASAAARAGCDLLIEKPLSDSMAGVDDLVGIARGEGLVTLVGCNMRFHPAIETIEALLTEEVIGSVLSARIEAGSYLPEWHPDRDYRESYSALADRGGGAILDFVHELDYARWFFGGVATVSCLAGQVSSLDIETEDVAEILLRFESGAIGEIHLDYVQRPYSRSVQVIGEKGTIRWEWEGNAVRWHSEETDEWRTRSLPKNWETNEMYVDEARHFLDCVSSRQPTTCDLTDGQATLELALAARESARSGQHISLRNGETN